ncbi:MAG: hypothetical protein EHM83_01480 [Burkholderiales bacterium]|nr:MAG: hypothetical protein EHM83_01480 [Burkholderiales bacterium]
MSRPFSCRCRDGRLRWGRFARAAGLLGLVAVVTGAGQADDGDAALVANSAPGATRVAILDCASGRPRATITLPAALAAEAALAPDGSALFASTRGRELLRYSVPGLREQARVPLEFEPTALAAAGGPDAVVLAGGRGAGALSAHDPATLAELQRYRLAEPFSVSAILDAPARRRFVIAFADLAEAWEIAYDPGAPPVLQGLVHDYRMGEAVPLPGRLTPRRFELPGPTQSLSAGAAPYEVARIDRSGALGIVHLDVRREIERPRTAAAPSPGRVSAWGSGARRGWLIAAPGAAAAEVLEVADWRVTGRIAVDGEILALAAARGRVLVAHARPDGVAVSLLDVARRAAEPIVTRLSSPALPLRLAAGTGGCYALFDRDDRWLAGFVVPPR